jgi:hypothetical protein
LTAGKHREIAAHSVAIEARTNLLFSFEKMALRDAVKLAGGARALAQGLYDCLHGTVVTVLGFAQPAHHMFLKPTVTRKAAQALGLPFEYRSRPDWETYAELLRVARQGPARSATA